VLFLDEPTTGLDPRGRMEMWDVIDELVKGGVTLLLTTHYLEEAQELCNEIAFIKGGKIIMQNSKEKILSMLDSKTIILRNLNSETYVQNSNFTVEKHGSDVKIHYKPSLINPMEILVYLQQNGYDIKDFAIEDPSLDDVFSYVINR
jgi:ABC-2 type transport system ATP-binding protein